MKNNQVRLCDSDEYNKNVISCFVCYGNIVLFVIKFVVNILWPLKLTKCPSSHSYLSVRESCPIREAKGAVSFH